MSGLRTVNIISSRLQIRRFLLGEVDAIMAIRNDANLLQFIPWWAPLSPTQAWNFVAAQAVCNVGAPEAEAHMAVVDRRTSAIVGICFLKVDSSGTQAEMGVMLSTAWRGRGYEQEVLRTLGIWAKAGGDGPRVQRLTILIDARDTAVLTGSGAAGFAMVSQGMWGGQFPYYVAAM